MICSELKLSISKELKKYAPYSKKTCDKFDTEFIGLIYSRI